MSEFKTIGEVSTQLGIPQHVLRFWEAQFIQIKPVKRRGGRRFYSETDIETIEKIKNLLYNNGYTIQGAKKALNQNFIPIDLDEMRKKKKDSDNRQADIFQALSQPNYDEKQKLQRILDSLKEIQKLLNQAS